MRRKVVWRDVALVLYQLLASVTLGSSKYTWMKKSYKIASLMEMLVNKLASSKLR